ncbi:hypothetical protein HF896_12175 [Alicycliphilus denitrificans]|uniref:Uncharacterized protein n=1 Tax=Alicycliphilus denitrificans TaxID=179636 RepID=A0A858ZTV9_9BURK|nr:hypothetical protein [Alicycliphilus denitrificans]QKD44335.1 hypothetical protein HF896_12175 [Alicycliphilus denitrificans]
MICLNLLPGIIAHTLKVLGSVFPSGEIRFSVRAFDARSAAEVTKVAFDQSVFCVDGRRLCLEGLATIQDTMQAGTLVVRSKFTVLDGLRLPCILLRLRLSSAMQMSISLSISDVM